jgi:hypothetical protein
MHKADRVNFQTRERGWIRMVWLMVGHTVGHTVHNHVTVCKEWCIHMVWLMVGHTDGHTVHNHIRRCLQTGIRGGSHERVHAHVSDGPLPVTTPWVCAEQRLPLCFDSSALGAA